MNREIKFRGISIDEWVYGMLCTEIDAIFKIKQQQILQELYGKKVKKNETTEQTQ